MSEAIPKKIARDVIDNWDGRIDKTPLHEIIAKHTDPMEAKIADLEKCIDDYDPAMSERIKIKQRKNGEQRKTIATLRKALEKALDRAKLIEKKNLGYVDKGLVIGVALACEAGLGKQPEKSDEVICEICGAPTEGKSICSPCYSSEVNDE